MDFKLLGITFRLEIVILCILFFYVISGHMAYSCTKITTKEGFQILKDVGSTINYSMMNGVPSTSCNAKVDKVDRNAPMPMSDENFFTTTEFKN